MTHRRKGGTIATRPIMVTVNDTEYELIPNLQAVRGVTAACGGLRPAFQRVQDMDFDTIAAIIIAGADLRLKPSEVDGMVEAIWRADDKVAIARPVMDFLAVLWNGGRPLPPDDEPQTETQEGN